MMRRSGSGKNISAEQRESAPGRLRIVAGIWRNRVLRVADVPGLRPTPERIRETLFNWLRLEIVGARCLDLFAGTGALGLEALSRGAAEVHFVEISRRACATLEQNISSLDTSAAIAHAVDAVKFLKESPERPYNVVFLDPPFADEKIEVVCRLLHDGQWLAANATVYLEQDRARAEPVLPGSWQTLKEKTAGNVRYRLVSPGGD